MSFEFKFCSFQPDRIVQKNEKIIKAYVVVAAIERYDTDRGILCLAFRQVNPKYKAITTGIRLSSQIDWAKKKKVYIRST